MGQDVKDDAYEWVQIGLEKIRWFKESVQDKELEQLAWLGMSESYLGLGRALWLHGDTLEEVHAEFRNAAEAVERMLQMAYDTKSKHYRGGRANPAVGSYVSAISGMNAALMAGDFGLAERLGRLVPAKPRVPSSTPLEVRNYALGLSSFLQGQKEKARTYVDQVSSSKSSGELYVLNYSTLAKALAGIISGSDPQFNEGLLAQAELHREAIEDEYDGTPQEYICDHLVALGNLGLKNGRKVKTDLPFLPRGLLIKQ